MEAHPQYTHNIVSAFINTYRICVQSCRFNLSVRHHSLIRPVLCQNVYYTICMHLYSIYSAGKKGNLIQHGADPDNHPDLVKENAESTLRTELYLVLAGSLCVCLFGVQITFCAHVL